MWRVYRSPWTQHGGPLVWLASVPSAVIWLDDRVVPPARGRVTWSRRSFVEATRCGSTARSIVSWGSSSPGSSGWALVQRLAGMRPNGLGRGACASGRIPRNAAGRHAIGILLDSRRRATGTDLRVRRSSPAWESASGSNGARRGSHFDLVFDEEAPRSRGGGTGRCTSSLTRYAQLSQPVPNGFERGRRQMRELHLDEHFAPRTARSSTSASQMLGSCVQLLDVRPLVGQAFAQGHAAARTPRGSFAFSIDADVTRTSPASLRAALDRSSGLPTIVLHATPACRSSSGTHRGRC